MDFSIVYAAEESKALLSSVISAADSNKRELGFLPPAAYEAQADKGRLWVLVDKDRQYLGHLMFSGHRQALKVTQIFINPAFRRRGYGDQVITALKNHAQQNGYQYIQARVAADLPANNFWDKNGFIILRQVRGGDTTNRLINERAWFVPSAALFDTTHEGKRLTAAKSRALSKLPSYVLDTNIVIDYSRQRSEFQYVETLLQMALGQELRLRGTPELENELSRGASYSTTDAVVRLARLIPSLSLLATTVIDKRLSELLPIVFSGKNSINDLKQNERSDLVHLAYCIEHGQDGFVTRDGPVLRAANAIGSKYGLEILTPHDLVPADEVPVNHSFSDGGAVNLSFSWAPSDQIRAVVSTTFTPELQAYIDGMYPDWKSRDVGDLKCLVVTLNGRVVGQALVLWNSSDSSWDIIISPVESLLVGRGVIDEVLQNVYSLCRVQHATPVSIVLASESLEIYQQALDNGFAICDSRNDSTQVFTLRRLIYRGILGQDEWPDIVSCMRRTFGWKLSERIPTHEEFVNTGVRVDLIDGSTGHIFVKLGDFEKLISPGIVLLGTRPAALVPIKLEFARQLLPETEITHDMLEGMEAGMYAERAYFSYSKGAFPVQPGGIVVFYVSGQGEEMGVAKALATVTSVASTTELEARRNYLARGVLTLKESDKQVTVITFTNIGTLPKAVPFAWMRDKGIIGGAGLVTSQRITGNHLRAIINYKSD